MNLSEVPIRADNFKIIDRGSLLAFFTVVLGAIRIHSCGVFQRPDGTVWVSLPRREWTDPDGNRHFFPLVELPRNLRQRIEETVQEAWSEIAGQPASTGTPESEWNAGVGAGQSSEGQPIFAPGAGRKRR